MPITRISSTVDSATFTKTSEETFSIELKDCSFTFYHSDASTPEELAGWYCSMNHPILGSSSVKMSSYLDPAEYEKAVQEIIGTFQAFVLNTPE